MANVYRADQFGSLVPPELPTGGAPEVAAVKQLIKLQREAGIDVLCDGQVTRTSECSIFAGRLAGVRSDLEGTPGVEPYVAGPLQRLGRLTAAEIERLRASSVVPFKITLPTPTAAALQMFREGITEAHYATPRDLAAALATILRDEVQDLIDDGVPYIQLDGPVYEQVPDHAGFAVIGEMLQLDAFALTGLRRSADLALGLSLPRAPDAQSSCYAEPVLRRQRLSAVEIAFEQMPVDRILIAFAESAESEFAALRAVPPDKIAVLGLVDPLTPRAADLDRLLEQIDVAATFTDAKRIAWSPRHGFAAAGTPYDAPRFAAQGRSLALTVDTVRRYWGVEM